MRSIYLAPLAFLLPCAVFGMGMLTQWDRADSAEYRAQGWEEIARKQGDAMDNLMKEDAELKAASARLQAACARGN